MSLKKGRLAPKIDKGRCTGCGRCVAACRQRLISLEVSGFRKYAELASSACCTRCLACLAACPVRAATAPEPDSDVR